MWVVKLGGSLQDSAELIEWLSVLEGCCGLPLLIVPGGGRFADAVRVQQEQFGYCDATAHRRALLAMEQYACRLVEGRASLCPAADWQEIRGVLQGGHIPVWMPAKLVNSEPHLPASWDLTSDSLAAWAARKLSAAQLILVKSASPPGTASTLDALADCGYVDRMFPRFAVECFGAIACLSKSEHDLLKSAITGRQALPDRCIVWNNRTSRRAIGGES